MLRRNIPLDPCKESLKQEQYRCRDDDVDRQVCSERSIKAPLKTHELNRQQHYEKNIDLEIGYLIE